MTMQKTENINPGLVRRKLQDVLPDGLLVNRSDFAIITARVTSILVIVRRFRERLLTNGASSISFSTGFHTNILVNKR